MATNQVTVTANTFNPATQTYSSSSTPNTTTTPTKTNSGVISMNQMTPATPMQTPQVPADTTNYTGITGGVTDGIANSFNTVNQQYQDQLAKKNADGTAITDAMAKLLNKEADTQTANTTAGVDTATADLNKYVQQLADLNAQSSALNREAQAIPLQVRQENATSGITIDGAQTISNGRLRDNALRALSIGQQSDIAYAAATGSQLRLNAAKDKAQQIIDLKYKPIEAELAIRQKQYDLNKDMLSDIDKKRTEALGIALKQEADKVQQNKDLENKTVDLKIEIAKNGGNPNIIDGAKSLSEAINKATPYLRTPNTEVVKLGDNAAYLIDKTTGKVIKSFGGGGGTTPTGNGGAKTITLPNGQTTSYSGIADTIIASGKFTKDQATAIRNAINNGENPVEVIKNQAKQLLSGANQTKLESLEESLSAMNDLDKNLKAFYAAGGKTSLLNGSYEKVVNNLGSVNDPNLVGIAVQIAQNLQSYRNAVSGTAYSVQEGKDIASVFPSISKSKGLNDAVVSGRKTALASSIDGYYKSVLGDKGLGVINQVNQATNNPVIAKGAMTDPQFVEKALSSKGVKYTDVINNTPNGQIPVIDNKTGEWGYIPYQEFDPKIYTKA